MSTDDRQGVHDPVAEGAPSALRDYPARLSAREIARVNEKAWDSEAVNAHWATVPLDAERWRGARDCGFPVSLTGSRPLPEEWLDSVKGRKVLCMACGGGQQSVLFAGRGAHVTSLENSEHQLRRDIETAQTFGVSLNGVKGSMDDQSIIDGATFDMVVLGMGAQFVSDLSPVFRNVRRLMKTGGAFIGAFVNPVCYIFDWKAQEGGRLETRHKVPYSDLTSISSEERLSLFGDAAPLEFGHSLEQIFGGMTNSGLSIDGYIEEEDSGEKLADHLPSYFAVRATPR